MRLIINFAKVLSGDKLIRRSSLLFVGAIIGNFFGYLFQITMGRLLSIEEFGEMNALFSLMMLVGVPFITIENYLSKNVSHYFTTQEIKKCNYFIISNYKHAFGWMSGLLILGVVFSQQIATNLKVDSAMPVIWLFVAIFLSTAVPLNTGIFQGLHNFRMLFFLSTSTAIFRYGATVALVVAGFGLNGVMGGTVMAFFLVGLISYAAVRPTLALGSEKVQNQTSYISQIGPMFLANLSFVLYSQTDLLLVKYFFSPHQAGIYSSAAILGKAVMYLPGAIVSSLFPMVASGRASDEDTMHLLYKALGLTFLLSGTGSLILYAAPELIIGILFSAKYSVAAQLLGPFALAVFPMALSLILMNYCLARGVKHFIYPFVGFALVQVVMISLHHNELMDILKIIFTTNACSVVLVSYFIHRDAKAHAKAALSTP